MERLIIYCRNIVFIYKLSSDDGKIISYAYHIHRDLMDGHSLVWYHCIHKQRKEICPAFEGFFLLKKCVLNYRIELIRTLMVYTNNTFNIRLS